MNKPHEEAPVTLVEDVEILRAACCIAGRDGVITDREGQMLRKLKERVGVGEASFQAMLDVAKDDPTYYERLFNMLQSHADRTLKILCSVAAADGAVGEDEAGVLRYFAEKLDMPTERFNAMLEAAHRTAGELGEG